MINKNSEFKFKRCLATFGYRKLNEHTYAKPIAYIIIKVDISDGVAEFSALFKSDSSEEDEEFRVVRFSSTKFDFESHSDRFETQEELACSIAAIEYEMFASGSLVQCGLRHDPWNFYTTQDLMNY